MSETKTELKQIKRNELGLIEGIEYKFDQNGLIDWRKMIKPEFLVPNKEKTQETDVTKLEDSQLIILLGGLKDLAQMRGYASVEYNVVAATPNYFATSCKIMWVPNYETEGEYRTFEALADASDANTDGFASMYLAAIAENRAFARCVRNFLRINIVSKEELKTSNPTEEVSAVVVPSKPIDTLFALITKKKIGFDKIKAFLVKEKVENAENWTKLEDLKALPAPFVLEFIAKIQKAKSN